MRRSTPWWLCRCVHCKHEQEVRGNALRHVRPRCKGCGRNDGPAFRLFGEEEA